MPKDAAAWRHIVESARTVFEHAGAGEIHTPIFEQSGVFAKAVGESSDIVRKEMFSFTDRGGRDLTLRPEATAAIVRAYIEHGMGSLVTPVRLWTFEPMFRGERPQRGRERQFHQLGYEMLGLSEALADAECIEVGFQLLKNLNIQNFQIHIGSVGDPEDREKYNQYLRAQLSPHHTRLSNDSQERLVLNPMRIIDSKDKADQALLQELNLKPMLDFLGEAALAHFQLLQKYLTDWAVPFVVDASIVRGLDYYRRTAFEFIHLHEKLAACATILAGGRYDGLAEILGGQPTPGVGWGCGVERVLLAFEAESIVVQDASAPIAYVVPLDELSLSPAYKLASDLRQNFKVICASKVKPVGKALQDAEKRGAAFAIILGENERENNTVTIKNLNTREQIMIKKTQLAAWLKEKGKA